MTIEELMKEAHETAIEKGWWEDEAGERSFGDQLANMHAELSEVWEAYRENGLEDEFLLFGEDVDLIGDLTFRFMDAEELATRPETKPEGIAAEFADVLIRIFDTCERYEIPLVEGLKRKMAYNKTRLYRHGGKKA